MGVHDSGSDIAKYIVIVERSVKFDESIKGSKFLTNKIESCVWNNHKLTQFNEFESEIESETTDFQSCEPGADSEKDDSPNDENTLTLRR
jgi:hypothetical protein